MGRERVKAWSGWNITDSYDFYIGGHYESVVTKWIPTIGRNFTIPCKGFNYKTGTAIVASEYKRFAESNLTPEELLATGDLRLR